MQLGKDKNAQTNVTVPREERQLELLRLPMNFLVRVVMLVCRKADRQFNRVILNEKQHAWDRAVRAHRRGMAKMRLACKVFSTPVLQGHRWRSLRAVMLWKRKTVLRYASSDSDDTWSGDEEEEGTVKTVARDVLGPLMGRLPTEVLNRIMRLVRRQAEQRYEQVREDWKVDTWSAVVRAYEMGLARICMTCRALANGQRAVQEGQQAMLAARGWRGSVRLKIWNESTGTVWDDFYSAYTYTWEETLGGRKPVHLLHVPTGSDAEQFPYTWVETPGGWTQLEGGGATGSDAEHPISSVDSEDGKEVVVLGEDTESDDGWTFEMLQLGIMNSRTVTLEELELKCAQQLRAILAQADELQEKKRKATEMREIIEHEVAMRQRNKRECGCDLPESGIVWFCEKCAYELASENSPKFCPLCEEEITQPTTKIRGVSQLAPKKKQRVAD